MKKLIIIVAALCASALLCSCGIMARPQRIIGESELYSSREIESMMDEIERTFNSGFEDCHLLDIRYDEEFSNYRCDEWAKQYDADRAVVLTSSFRVDMTGDNPVLTPGVYENYQWILTQNRGGRWQAQTWGYG